MGIRTPSTYVHLMFIVCIRSVCFLRSFFLLLLFFARLRKQNHRHISLHGVVRTFNESSIRHHILFLHATSHSLPRLRCLHRSFLALCCRLHVLVDVDVGFVVVVVKLLSFLLAQASGYTFLSRTEIQVFTKFQSRATEMFRDVLFFFVFFAFCRRAKYLRSSVNKRLGSDRSDGNDGGKGGGGRERKERTKFRIEG